MAVFSTDLARPYRHHRAGPTFFERFDAFFTAVAKARVGVQAVPRPAAAPNAGFKETQDRERRQDAVRHAARAYL